MINLLLTIIYIFQSILSYFYIIDLAYDNKIKTEEKVEKKILDNKIDESDENKNNIYFKLTPKKIIKTEDNTKKTKNEKKISTSSEIEKKDKTLLNHKETTKTNDYVTNTQVNDEKKFFIVQNNSFRKLPNSVNLKIKKYFFSKYLNELMEPYKITASRYLNYGDFIEANSFGVFMKDKLMNYISKLYTQIIVKAIKEKYKDKEKEFNSVFYNKKNLNEKEFDHEGLDLIIKRDSLYINNYFYYYFSIGHSWDGYFQTYFYSENKILPLTDNFSLLEKNIYHLYKDEEKIKIGLRAHIKGLEFIANENKELKLNRIMELNSLFAGIFLIDFPFVNSFLNFVSGKKTPAIDTNDNAPSCKKFMTILKNMQNKT